MKLTFMMVKNAKPKTKPYKLSDGGGLHLYVKPNGSRLWRFRYRFDEKEKTLSIGPFPLVSLLEAREARDDAKRLLLEGVDPMVEKKKKKLTTIQNYQNTFKFVALDWYDNRKHIWSKRYADEVMKRLEADIFPEIGNYPITEIEPPVLLQVIRKIERRGAHELAKRQLQKCGEIFRYAIACGYGVRDPSRDIKEALKPVKKSHFASIDVRELPEFLNALEKNDARLYQSTRNAIKLIMLTFVRTSELINGKWEEIDWERKEWVIPAARMKMRKEHIVPLSDQAIAVLENQKEIARHFPHVFPSQFKPRQPMSNNTILGALKRLGYQGKMTGHGFRALAMSAIKQELGYRHEVVDRQLAHTPKSKIDKAYDRAMFLEDRKRMMQDWADYIDSMTPGHPAEGTFKKAG